MPHIEKTTEIELPPEQVFGYAVDPSTRPDWAIFLKELKITEGDGKSAGSKESWRFKLGPRTQSLEAVVTAFNENQAVVRRVTSGLQLEERMTFSPAGDGGTRVVWTVDYAPPMGLLGLLMDTILMNRVFQNDIETSLENLKEKLEG